MRGQCLAIELEIALALEALHLRRDGVALSGAIEELVEQCGVDTHVEGRLQMFYQGGPEELRSDIDVRVCNARNARLD